MAAKTGRGVKQIVDVIEGLFREWADKAASMGAVFDQGRPMPMDVLANSGYHAARSALGKFDAMQGLITAKGWSTEVRAEAVARHGAGYDIIAETQAFRALLESFQDAVVVAVGGVDADGYIQANYIKLTPAGPYFNAVSAVDYAPVNVALQQILASVEA